MQLSFDLEKPLFRFSSNGSSLPFSIRDSFTGVAIFGATGSGKTSGPGAFLAKKYLAAGYGGCVLTTKPGEKEQWQEYCRATNRERDLLVVEPEGSAVFNFLDYEASHSKESSYTQNIAETLKVVIRSSEEKSSGKSDDPFWENALDQLVFFSLELCLLAYGKLSIQQLYEVALSAPQKDVKPDLKRKTPFVKAFDAAQTHVNGQIFQYIDGLDRADKEKIKRTENFEPMVLAMVPDAVRLKAVDQFFIETYNNLSEKTRSIVNFSWAGFLFTLLQEPVYSLFCGKASTFTPEDCWNKGKIILLNLPVKLYHKAGRDAQILFKYIWQKAVERRNITRNDRPLVLFLDEAQNFLNAYDTEYLATARSSRIANVFLSQNLPNYYAFMGGDSHKSQHKVQSLLGNLATKIFCCNTNVETNKWASDLIGGGFTEKTSRSSTVSGDFSSGQSASYELEPMVRPELFGLLLQGGPKNGLIVETYIHRQGELFDNRHNYKKVIFKQV